MKLKKHNRYAYSPITERQDFTCPEGKRLAFWIGDLERERQQGAARETAARERSDAGSSGDSSVKRTAEAEERAKERPGFLNFPDILPIQGGLPITVQGEVVGAIGVSGVQSQEDEQVAAAGIAALG